MATIQKRVVRSDLWIDRAFDEGLAREPDISLQRLPGGGQSGRRLGHAGRRARLSHLCREGRTAAGVVRARGAARALPEPAVRVGRRCGLRHSGRGSLHGGRRGSREPGRRQRGLGRGTHPRAHARRLAPDGRGRPPHASRDRLRARRRDGPRDPRQDHGPGRHRPHRHARRGARARIRHGSDRDRPLPVARGNRAARRQARCRSRNCSRSPTSCRCTARAMRAR